MDTTGLYWSVEECAWVRAPVTADALATPWSGHALPVPAAAPRVRDLWDVVGWFPPLPGLPDQRATAADQQVREPT